MNELRKNRDSLEGGQVIKYRKNKISILGDVLILIMFPLTIIGIVGQSAEMLKNNVPGFSLSAPYFGTLFMLGLLQIAVGGMTGYIGNKITVSHSFITIKRPALGKTYIISKRILIAKQMVSIINRIENYQIILYLKNGRKIKTGFLYCKGRGEFYKIYREFKCQEIAAGKNSHDPADDEINQGDFIIKTNHFVKVLVLLPILMMTALIICYNIWI